MTNLFRQQLQPKSMQKGEIPDPRAGSTKFRAPPLSAAGVRVGYNIQLMSGIKKPSHLKNRAFHFPLPDLRNGASLPSPHVRNSGFRPFRMWHPRVRTRRTGGFRSHGSHASKRRSSRRNRPINQSINHLECCPQPTATCIYTYTRGGESTNRAGRFVQ